MLGLHDPDVGSGRADRRDSLVGVAPFPTGSYSNATVPIFETPFTVTDPDLPPSGTTEVTATLWHGPAGPYTGPIRVDGRLVQDTATIEF